MSGVIRVRTPASFSLNCRLKVASIVPPMLTFMPSAPLTTFSAPTLNAMSGKLCGEDPAPRMWC